MFKLPARRLAPWFLLPLAVGSCAADTQAPHEETQASREALTAGAGSVGDCNGNPARCTGVLLALGTFHTVALKSDGSVWAWGPNYYGELGDGTTTERDTPVVLSGLTGVTAVAAGGSHTVALKSDGSVWAWGANWEGQLGDGTTTDRTTPGPVSGLTGVTAVAASARHNVALKSDGTVWAWGYNSQGELGDGTKTDRHEPVPVSGLAGVTAVVAGDSHTLALKSDGTVWAWGANYAGQLGDGTTTGRTTPGPVSGLTGVTAVTRCVALKSDGTVWAWGNNNVGQLGNGTTTNQLTPVPVSGLPGITAVTASGWHTLALTSDGSVWAWGDNFYGELGDGTKTERHEPVPVSGLTGVTAMTAGDGSDTVALKSDGTVWAWGNNERGQLGDGTITSRATPGPVSGLTLVPVCGTLPVCDSSGTACVAPLVADGTSCDDACTPSGTCQAGTCTGASPVVCAAQDECHIAGACDATSGICTNPAVSDGTTCSLGTCQIGICTTPPDLGTGGAGGTGGESTSGPAGSGGAGAASGDYRLFGRACACTVAGGEDPVSRAPWSLGAIGGLGLLVALRRWLRSTRAFAQNSTIAVSELAAPTNRTARVSKQAGLQHGARRKSLASETPCGTTFTGTAATNVAAARRIAASNGSSTSWPWSTRASPSTRSGPPCVKACSSRSSKAPCSSS